MYKRQLLVFINPQVLENNEDIESFSIEKREYMEKERTRQNEGVESEQPFFMEYAPKSKQKTDEKGAQ